MQLIFAVIFFVVSCIVGVISTVVKVVMQVFCSGLVLVALYQLYQVGAAAMTFPLYMSAVLTFTLWVTGAVFVLWGIIIVLSLIGAMIFGSK